MKGRRGFPRISLLRAAVLLAVLSSAACSDALLPFRGGPASPASGKPGETAREPAEDPLRGLAVALPSGEDGTVRLGALIGAVSKGLGWDLLVDPAVLPGGALMGKACPFSGGRMELRWILEGVAESLDAEYLVLPGNTIWFTRGGRIPGNDEPAAKVLTVELLFERGGGAAFLQWLDGWVRPLEPYFGPVHFKLDEDAFTLLVSAHPLVIEDLQAVFECLREKGGAGPPAAQVRSPVEPIETPPPARPAADLLLVAVPGRSAADHLRDAAFETGSSLAWDAALEELRYEGPARQMAAKELVTAAAPGRGFDFRPEGSMTWVGPGDRPARASREVPLGKGAVRSYGLGPAVAAMGGDGAALVRDFLSQRLTRKVRVSDRAFARVEVISGGARLLVRGSPCFLERAEPELAAILEAWPGILEGRGE